MDYNSKHAETKALPHRCKRHQLFHCPLVKIEPWHYPYLNMPTLLLYTLVKLEPHH